MSEIDVIESFENDPAAFIEIFLGRELSSKQKEFLDETKKRKHIVAIWSRQTGKSTVIASYIVWRLLYGKGTTVQGEHMDEKIAILAPIKEQHILIYDKIRTLVDKSDFISQYIVKINSERIVIKNGNQARFMSASPGSHIRGYTATCIVIDESQDITDNKYSADILPFGATTNALIIEAGTPKTKNHFFQALKSKTVKVIRQLWFECPFLSKEYVMSQKEKSPDALFRQEYLTEFIEEGVLAFPSKLFEPEAKDGRPTGRWNLADYDYISNRKDLSKEEVAKVTKLIEEDGATFVSGLDLGKERDPTVYTIIRDDIRPLRYAVQIVFPLGTSYSEVAETIAMFYNVYGPREFNADCSNERSFIELLKTNDVPIVNDKKQIRGALHFTNKNKEEMVNTAVVLFEKYSFQLPKTAEKLLQQFLNQQFEINEQTHLKKFFHPSNEHDDMLWSTLLALKNMTMYTPNDVSTFSNPWEKTDNFIHGETRKRAKEVLAANTHARIKRRKNATRYQNAMQRRSASRGFTMR